MLRSNVRQNLSDSAIPSLPVNKPDANKALAEHAQDFNSNLIQAIQAVDIEEAKKALQSGANVTCDRNKPLTLAATIGETDIVALLLQNGGQINMSNDRGETPLLVAVINENFSTVKYLIESGAYVDATNQNGDTPLHVACIKGNQ